MQAEDWDAPHTRGVAWLINGKAPSSSIQRQADDASVFIAMNGWHEGVEFTLPPCPGGGAWVRQIDTALEQQESVDVESAGSYTATGRSVLVFTSR